jgi:cytochrome c
MKTGRAISTVICLSLMFSCAVVFAQNSPDELAKESEAYCASTASVKPTPQMIIDKVNAACELLKKEGKAAFPKFQGKDSEFIYAGTYIWIHDTQCVMRMHPMKYKMNGQSIVDFKDPNQKRFFVDMNKVAKEKGAGWVDYMWPKPGEKEPSQKVSYVKLVTVEGEEFVVGSGVYDLPEAEVKKLLQ